MDDEQRHFSHAAESSSDATPCRCRSPRVPWKQVTDAAAELICPVQRPVKESLSQGEKNPRCSFSSAASFCSHVGLQALETVHPLHVALDGGLARDWLSTLGEEPTSLSVAQSFALIPAWEEEMVVNEKRKTVISPS